MERKLSQPPPKEAVMNSHEWKPEWSGQECGPGRAPQSSICCLNCGCSNEIPYPGISPAECATGGVVCADRFVADRGCGGLV